MDIKKPQLGKVEAFADFFEGGSATPSFSVYIYNIDAPVFRLDPKIPSVFYSQKDVKSARSFLPNSLWETYSLSPTAKTTWYLELSKRRIDSAETPENGR